jgi:hypothetical protein
VFVSDNKLYCELVVVQIVTAVLVSFSVIMWE